ncbi:hypothetical protein [Pseudomonas aeruginosa]|uniref:hypothetical protein n=2 Tax=root TaxID=1 RepID=UPI0032B38797
MMRRVYLSGPMTGLPYPHRNTPMHQLTAHHRPGGVTVTGWPEESQLMTPDDILLFARAVRQIAINQAQGAEGVQVYPEVDDGSQGEDQA